MGAYLTFNKSLRQGNLEAAWKLLSTPTQRVFEERTKEVGNKSGGTLELKPSVIAFANVPRPPDVTEVQLVREEGERAVVEVTHGAERRTVQLVRENGTWKIDLTEALKI